MRTIYPKNVYELRELLFGKLGGFNFQVSEENRLFNYLALFVFESIRLATEELNETQNINWIGKHSCSNFSLYIIEAD